MAALPVLVSLPRNDVDLARAAVDAGADGLKVHINVTHRASGTRFGSLAEERACLETILSLGLPTGIVPGASPVAPALLRELARMGFAYIDVYGEHALPTYTEDCVPATPMVALGPHDHPAEAAALADMGVMAFELSTLDPSRYGTSLTLDTVARLAATRAVTTLPLVVPSQHALTPDDLPVLAGAGASSVLLGAVVTGTTVESVSRAVAQFTGRTGNPAVR